MKSIYPLRLLVFSVACLISTAWGAVLLYRDLSAPTAIQHGKVWANIERKEFWVRRKPARDYLWSKLNTGDALFHKDSVQVGPESSATIRLASGGLLELEENSLMVLDESEDFQANLLAGSFVLKDKQGDRRVVRDASGKSSTVTLAASLLEPSTRAAYTVIPEKKHRVGFRWRWRARALASDKAVFLQWSSDRTFQKLEQQRAPLSTVSAVLELPEGLYYWRLYTPGEVLSEVRSFRIVEHAMPQPLYPVGGEVVSRWNPRDAMKFEWTVAPGSDDAGATRIEISSSANFSKPVRWPVEQTLGGISVDGLDVGKWYWRLVSYYSRGEEFGKVEQFEIKKNARVAIKLVTPRDDIFGSVSQRIPFEWHMEASPADVTLEIDEISNKAEPLQLRQPLGKRRSFEWEGVRAGQFRWRLVASVGETVVGESSWQTFTLLRDKPISLSAPLAGAEIPYVIPVSTLSFMWEDVLSSRSDGLSYRWVLGRDRGLSHPVLSRSLAKAQTVVSNQPLESGIYYWRVDTVDAEGTRFSTSQVSQFVLDADPQLATVELLSPADAETLNLVYGKKSIRLSWTPVSLAKGYLVKVFSPKKKIFEHESSETKVTLPRLKEGKYTWQVETVDFKNRIGKSSIVRSFVVDYGPPLPAPKSVISEVQ